MIVRIDIWGGEKSGDHLARYHVRIGDHFGGLIARELRDGFLVNARMLERGEGWGPNVDFDLRGAQNVRGRA